ncbi:MAG: hypothetical protein IJ080_00590 [Oscillospiraceae bacterium]|nr:hypothetical protein [Oscillospiraceae bacterium]MBQ8978242.1 hypothetical protein [Oscillospiraceae bacterium]
MMNIADTIAGVVLLGGMFLIFTSVNIRIMILMIKKADHIPSMTPLIGGLAGAALVMALSGTEYPLLILLPLLIDPGSIPLIIRLIFSLIFR